MDQKRMHKIAVIYKPVLFYLKQQRSSCCLVVRSRISTHAHMRGCTLDLPSRCTTNSHTASIEVLVDVSYCLVDIQ
jgi:hypothetical protein